MATRRSPTSKSSAGTAAAKHGLAIEFRQSNHEGEIIDWIQQARAEKAAGLIINPAGYGHTSVAILDALATLERRLSKCISATFMLASRFAGALMFRKSRAP